MLLAIDTSAGTSVAVVDGATGVCVERSVNDTRRHAEVIGELIAECLAAVGVNTAALNVVGPNTAGPNGDGTQLSAVAVGMGPGPFTGLRVGIAAATAFALGAQLPILRVASHDAVAFSHYRAGAGAGSRGPILVTTDARRHERYWSAYGGVDGDGVPLRVLGPAIDRSDSIATAIQEAVTDIGSYRRLDVEWVSAASVGALAELLETLGREFASTQPLYLRSPDVTLPSAPKRVSS